MLWYGFEVWSSLLVFQNAYLELILKVGSGACYQAIYCTCTIESTNQRRINLYCIYFHWKTFYLYLLYFYNKKDIFFHSEMFFSSFLLLITTNTSCHPLHELFRKNSYVHYIITLENVKKFWFLYLIDIINVRIAFKYYYY